MTENHRPLTFPERILQDQRRYEAQAQAALADDKDGQAPRVLPD